jgi:Domain of unknown function (DUF4139)/N-terminal domain of unknown function (DUF4140)
MKKSKLADYVKLLFIPCLICFNNAISAQTISEIELKSDIKEVTVYLIGAQISRSKTTEIPAGKSTISFTGLSPYIDPKSIQINGKGEFQILSVNLQDDYISQNGIPSENEELKKTKLEIEKKLKIESVYQDVLQDELTFLKNNSSIGGSNTGITIAALKEANNYFIERITAIKLKRVERQLILDDLTKQLTKIEKQLAGQTTKATNPSGVIVLKIEAKNPTRAVFDLKYIVANAGWTPSYDIKVKNIEQPVDIAYKANIQQNTLENWKNVSLKLSSADPNGSSSFRELRPYYLDYNLPPPVYTLKSGKVSGKIYDSRTGDPIQGASIFIQGSSIGNTSDKNGNYELSIPKNGGTLSVSFIGYQTKEIPILQEQINIGLEASIQELQEVVVTGYSKPEYELLGKVPGLSINNKFQKNKALVETQQTYHQTSVEFNIKTPYTILSDGKVQTVEIENYQLPAEYLYYCTPKIDEKAYLVAKIVDWEKYNFMEGEANLFFEDTYTGKTLLDVRYMSDTLSISLGNDKGVSVKRESQKKFSSKQYLGNKKDETKSWLITVKNNKSQPIQLMVYDQIPVSANGEIEVTPLNISNGNLIPETGILFWNFPLKNAASQQIELKYTVKLPKSKQLYIE